MNGIYGMDLQYESLVPIERPKDTFLSVGTVTFLMEGKELPLDFSITEGGTEGNAGSIVRINACIRNFDPKIFADEYEKLGLEASELDFSFFAARYHDTYLLEVYTEYFYQKSMVYLPVTLKSACLLFQDGQTLDYRDRITVCAQSRLAEVS